MRQRNIGKDIFMVAKAMTADKSETEIHPQKLEPHFSEWMSRLTGERLHSKADIACVLAVLSIDLQAANEQIKRVREETIEQAAKICEAWAKNRDSGIYADPDEAELLRSAADAIRALKC